MTPIDETMRALEDLVRAGKVIYPAVSNWSAWQTQRAVDIQERHNWARLQVIQPMYNLVKRQAEVEILPMAEANGIGVIPYSPAAAGLLSGKYLGQASGRLKTNKMYEARYGDAWMFEVAEKYVAFCKQKGLHPVSTAIAWVAAHPAVTAPDHRRAQCRPAEGLAGRGEDRHDAGAARRDRRALAHAAAGHRPVGGAEGRKSLEHIPKWCNHFLPSEAGEVSASYADGGVMSIVGGAHDPSARYAGTSPSRNSAKGKERANPYHRNTL